MNTDKSKWVEKLLSNAGFYLEKGSYRQAIEAYKEILISPAAAGYTL